MAAWVANPLVRLSNPVGASVTGWTWTPVPSSPMATLTAGSLDGSSDASSALGEHETKVDKADSDNDAVKNALIHLPLVGIT
jgi:hypothetical protein